jgi:hypothetical protein
MNNELMNTFFCWVVSVQNGYPIGEYTEGGTIKIEKYSVGNKNRNLILNDIIYIFCNLKKP